MKKVLYYHMYLTDNNCSWINIFLEQMNLIDSSNLLKDLDEIKITAIARENTDHQRLLIGLLREFGGPKISVSVISNPYANDEMMMSNIESQDTVTENVTMRKIYKDAFDCADEDYAICYIHNKGITKTVGYIDSHVLTRYYYWRQFLNYGVIENWQKCLYGLESHDVAGINLYEEPELHYSGAFWWTKASHIRKLPDPSTLGWWKAMKAQTQDHWLQSCSDRFRDEMWVCSAPGTKAFNVKPYQVNPASVLVKKSESI